MRVCVQDTVTGFLLAGVGHRTASGSNFLIVKHDTKLQLVEEAFQDFSTRDDVGIILINQHVANNIRHVLKNYNETIPTVLEIPSKEHPYDPEQDYIMVSVQLSHMLFRMFYVSSDVSWCLFRIATCQHVLGRWFIKIKIRVAAEIFRVMLQQRKRSFVASLRRAHFVMLPLIASVQRVASNCWRKFSVFFI